MNAQSQDKYAHAIAPKWALMVGLIFLVLALGALSSVLPTDAGSSHAEALATPTATPAAPGLADVAASFTVGDIGQFAQSPAAAAQAVGPDGTVVILDEGFEDAWPPPGWAAQPNWGASNCRAFAGIKSAWVEGGAGLACGSAYYSNEYAFLVYGPFSLADAAGASLSFRMWLDSEGGYDFLAYAASVDGTNFHGSASSGVMNGWTERVLDLGNVPSLGSLLGRSQVWIALAWDTDSSITLPEGAFVDQVRITKTTGVPPPTPTATRTPTPSPGHVELVGQLELRNLGHPVAVAVSGRYAYVAAWGDGLRVVDVANPAAPFEVTEYTTYNGSGVTLAGSYAYLASLDGGLHIFDVTDPGVLRHVGVFDTRGSAKGVAVVGNYAYVADGEAGLVIVDVANPAAPRQVGICDTHDDAQDVAVAGNYAYVADWLGDLRIIDVANPAAPREVSSYGNMDWAQDVAVAGNYAYVVDYIGGLRIVDITDPIAPRGAASYYTSGSARGVALADKYAYVADGDDGLIIIDVTDPTRPTRAGFYDTPGYAHNVAVVGNYIYLADGEKLLILRFTGAGPALTPTHTPTPTPTATATATPTRTPTPTPTATPSAPWLNWREPDRPLLVAERGASIDVLYGNIATPAVLTATLTGPAVFADGSQALAADITEASGSRSLLLKPASGAARGATFTLEVTLAGLRLAQTGVIVEAHYLPLVLKH